MCYFVEINLARKELEKHFGISMPEDPRYTPGFFHSAFTKPYLPVITNNDPGKIQLFRWGLIPAWVKDKQTADKILAGTFNARAESIWEKPSFRASARYKRCLVPAHGFFEWHTEGKKKTPFYIKRKDNSPFSFAGLYEVWTDFSTGEILQTFSIITTQANSMMEKIHNLKKRMPVILYPENERNWIKNDIEKDDLSKFLQPFPDHLLDAWPVNKEKILGKSDLSDPSIIEPIPLL
jgi:putative SOS response-associated peptidase YedK